MTLPRTCTKVGTYYIGGLRMRIIKYYEARQHFRAELDRVVAEGDITIIKSLSNEVVLMSLEHYNELVSKGKQS